MLPPSGGAVPKPLRNAPAGVGARDPRDQRGHRASVPQAALSRGGPSKLAVAARAMASGVSKLAQTRGQPEDSALREFFGDQTRRLLARAGQIDLPPQNRSRSCERIRAGAKGVGMARKRYAAEEIIGKLQEAEVVLAQGEAVAQVARRLGVAEPTYYRWRREYGGLRVDQAKRLKELERENSRLKRLVADQALANAMLQDVAAGNFCARPSGTGRHPPARTSTRCRSGGPARSPARRGRHSAPCPGRPRMRRR